MVQFLNDVDAYTPVPEIVAQGNDLGMCVIFIPLQLYYITYVSYTKPVAHRQ